MEFPFVYLFVVICLRVIIAQPVTDKPSVVTTTSDFSNETYYEEVETQEEPTRENYSPRLYEMTIFANVSNRFSNTVVVSKFENKEKISRETTFSVVLPNTAYIVSFIMEIEGKNYTATVKEKLQAQHIFVEAAYAGKAAAHVEASIRDSNKFTISVSLLPESKAAFYLTYEELLTRKEFYEIVININPKQLVDNLHIKVEISESRYLKSVKTLPFRSGNSIGESDEDLETNATITTPTLYKSIIEFNPSVEEQQKFAKALKQKEISGLCGQFVVQYDVERKYEGGDILIKDGYFVHFFSPDDLEPLPKHVVFILDTSGSMMFQKIEQLRIAMNSIISELKNEDKFHLVEFNNDVYVWNIAEPKKSVRFPKYKNDDFWFSESGKFFPIDNIEFPSAAIADNSSVNLTSDILNQMDANGGTNIYEALRVGLRLVQLEKLKNETNDHQPMLIFLTDGEPTIGKSDPLEIISTIRYLNTLQVPIFSLSFGDGADRDMLKRLSLENFGFCKHIYEAADAALQLQDFYKQISSPLLTNISFKYTEEVRKLTKTVFPIYFGGGEFVVTGYVDDVDEFGKNPKVSGWGVQGPINLRPHFQEPAGELERLWAYLTIQQMLNNIVPENRSRVEEKAMELAQKYSFVTPLTSLVVQKPNEGETLIDFESLSPQYDDDDGLLLSSMPIQLSSIDPGIMDFEDDSQMDNSTKSDSCAIEVLKLYGWMNEILNRNGCLLDLPQGNFSLVDKLLNPSVTNCQNFPDGYGSVTGRCTVLAACPNIASNITNLGQFEKHFCVINNEYAGICCPENTIES